MGSDNGFRNQALIKKKQFEMQMALSRNPLPANAHTVDLSPNQPIAESSEVPQSISDNKEKHIRIETATERGPRLDLDYYQPSEWKLPDDEKVARRITLQQSQFDLIDDILYHENPVTREVGEWWSPSVLSPDPTPSVRETVW